MRRVVYHRLAPREARELVEYYEQISEELADSFWQELLESIKYAQSFPERHHYDSTGMRRCNLHRFPVHFLFRANEEQIRITTFRHDRQNPDHGSKRT